MFRVWRTAPIEGTARYASRCSWSFQAKVPTLSPSPTPNRLRAAASRSARPATWAKVDRRSPAGSTVTTSLSPYTRWPCRRMPLMSRGPSCIVLSIAGAYRQARASPRARRRLMSSSAAPFPFVRGDLSAVEPEGLVPPRRDAGAVPVARIRAPPLQGEVDAEADQGPTEPLPGPDMHHAQTTRAGARLEDLASTVLRQLLHCRGMRHVLKNTRYCGQILSAMRP